MKITKKATLDISLVILIIVDAINAVDWYSILPEGSGGWLTALGTLGIVIRALTGTEAGKKLLRSIGGGIGKNPPNDG